MSGNKSDQVRTHTLLGNNGTMMRTAHLGNAGVLVSVLSPDAGAQPTEEAFSNAETGSELQKWGSDNMWPTRARIKVEQSTTAYPLIAKMVKIMFGKGLYYYKNVTIDGKPDKEILSIPEIDQWLADNDADYVCLERLMDYKMLGNVFGEYILKGDLSQITNYYHLEAEFSRFSMNTDLKKLTEIHYAGNWQSPGDPSVIPFISRRDLSPDLIKEKGGPKHKFATHSCLPSPGHTIYAVPPHNALFEDDGWLDYANTIPKIMNSINKNAMNLKYHIKIPVSYWENMHANWKNLDQKSRDKYIDEKLTEMDNWFAGTENAHKSFISHFATDRVTGKPLPGWEITAIEENGRKDAYVTVMQEADTQIARALDMDQSLSGIQASGGKMGAGSGSDKRVGMTNTISMSYADELVITEWLRVVQKYNQWDPAIRWGFRHEIPTTLNENKDGVETE